ncbi:uncharacterized protein LOC112513629 [Cynara cardunculus var. scolymus]|uniref:uncharacterized protein LOC112513629 n=1 Tax=Cynara cardunculus var. scolymus TaxID=59895 RepID=UPI000D62373B|nr:uncharacterized protein LOC112513629 [Cynara cardunculus var. scolymus]
MGFNSVYRVLQDIFQQVDSRILRAVAIEHPKDADVAVEVVLAEVIPRLSEQSRTNKGKSSLSLSEVVDGARTGQFEATMDSGDVLPCLSEQYTEAGPSNIGGSLPVAIEDADLSGQPNSPKVVEPVTSEPLCTSCFYDANGEIDTVCYGIPIPLENLVNNNINHECVTPASISENGVYDNHDYGCVKTGDQNAAKVSNSIASSVGVSGSIQEEAAINDKFTHENGVYDDHDHGFVKTGDQNAAKMSNSLASGAGVSGSIQEEAAINDKITLLDVDTEMIAPSSSQLLGTCEKDLTVTQELNSSSSSKTTSEKNSLAITIVDPEDELIMTSVLTRSDQTCSTELLQDIIEDARNDKKTLALAMDSVVNLMKEVEFKERAAEQAKERAACGCSDILAKVDELKQALWRAKEANDMHAGEVYAEKAILATELKELQLRLLNLSDERSRSLEILEEMRVALEIRLTTALKEIEAAEEEKLEKERSAKEALAYQESQMEMVVEESKKLKMEAEENSKLQEFLMDRGRAIDILQGEIYVKCQDVKLLKEKFDKRITLSSSQTSSILASSSSSFRTTGTPSEPELETYGTPKTNAELGDSYGFLDKSSTSRSGLARSPKSPTETVHTINDCFPSGEEKHHDDDRKMLLDDGWELFDNGEDLVF